MDNKILMTLTVTLLCGVLRADDQQALISGDQPKTMIFDRDLRIVGGMQARPSQFPHAVALALLLTTGESFCGGNIIHPIYVLTAAHCLDDLISINVQAGVTRLFRPPAYEARVFPRDVRMHPRYNPETLINDIALIFLQRRIIFNTEMQRILLPPRSHANNRFVGSLGTVIGWGRTSDSSRSMSPELRFVSLPILGDQHCQDVYNREYRFFQPTNICISGARGSSCSGDSGGGMHLTINGEMAIIGIVSYGSATCESGHPPVMTRVTSYLDWISSSTGIVIA